MNGDGGLYRRNTSPHWWMRYSLRGTQYREDDRGVVAVEGKGAEAAEREARKVLTGRRLEEVGADRIGARAVHHAKGLVSHGGQRDR